MQIGRQLWGAVLGGLVLASGESVNKTLYGVGINYDLDIDPRMKICTITDLEDLAREGHLVEGTHCLLEKRFADYLWIHPCPEDLVDFFQSEDFKIRIGLSSDFVGEEVDCGKYRLIKRKGKKGSKRYACQKLKTSVVSAHLQAALKGELGSGSSYKNIPVFTCEAGVPLKSFDCERVGSIQEINKTHAVTSWLFESLHRSVCVVNEQVALGFTDVVERVHEMCGIIFAKLEGPV